MCDAVTLNALKKAVADGQTRFPLGFVIYRAPSSPDLLLWSVYETVPAAVLRWKNMGTFTLEPIEVDFMGSKTRMRIWVGEPLDGAPKPECLDALNAYLAKSPTMCGMPRWERDPSLCLNCGTTDKLEHRGPYPCPCCKRLTLDHASAPIEKEVDAYVV